MKTHAIIPIFIPHLGCPNDCVFCNQKKITARTGPLTIQEMKFKIDEYLKTITGRGIQTTEIAFYGGSFTGIPKSDQEAYLSVAKEYKEAGKIQKVHLSTRPDYIDDQILALLKQHQVDIIELGVQSLDEEVLKLSNRGHSIQSVYDASLLIKAYGFELGLQLMIGLPGDTPEKSIASAKAVAQIGPSIGRLYPTIIIEDTELYSMYQNGSYKPFTMEETILTTKEMYRILTNAGVNVIRIGLKSTDHIATNGEIAGGYHPAFRQLVEAELAKDQMEDQLTQILLKDPNTQNIVFACNGTSFSNMIGNGRSNKIYFEKKYAQIRFQFHVDYSIPNLTYQIKLG